MSKEEYVRQLFEAWAGIPPEQLLAIGAHGSPRKYWRVAANNHCCIAAWNDDVRENEAFFYYSKALKSRGINVPEVFSVSSNRKCYLQQDLGDTTLYSILFEKQRAGSGFDASMLSLFKRVLTDLAAMQTVGRDMDFSHAYPRSDFDAQSIQWDLNYFKYCYLKLSYTPFDEELLERDFATLVEYLLDTDCSFFMHRDFQSRNIMLHHGQPWYIDFQGARRGAAQYDVASLLYSSQSNLPEPIRRELLNHYLKCLSTHRPVNPDQFRQRFYGYVLIRILQAMGAYGYRGYYEHKDCFFNSIHLAAHNIRTLLDSHPLPIPLPHLNDVLRYIVETSSPKPQPSPRAGLVVTVNSFSYKKGIPHDTSGNGGGYVFDCRALPNPGRYPEYKSYTGRDKPVIDFLQGDEQVERFITAAEQLVGGSISKYLERNFTSLTVSFGCTGGQHRSVYCAERLASWIVENFDCQVVINHVEQK